MVTPRFWIVQAVVFVLFCAALIMGWPQMMHAADATYLTLAIALLSVVGVIGEAFGLSRMADYLMDALPKAGLFGTVVGISIVTHNAGGEFSAMLGGMSTSFYTTVAGLIGAEWLRLTRLLK